ncbi:hypothetical protein JZ751_024131 [Albula glossodonta]|uniref:Uncharacterized protein n=1 Tax=Albula glossodonta TaxID=121402 RepID=A0A8T2NJG0_9TELE|nr:hypothetical protein JZ751_024131 [Albula glossodonta]
MERFLKKLTAMADHAEPSLGGERERVVFRINLHSFQLYPQTALPPSHLIHLQMQDKSKRYLSN